MNIDRKKSGLDRESKKTSPGEQTRQSGRGTWGQMQTPGEVVILNSQQSASGVNAYDSPAPAGTTSITSLDTCYRNNSSFRALECNEKLNTHKSGKTILPEQVTEDTCGDGRVVHFCPDCGSYISLVARCNSRFCPECNRIRAARLVELYKYSIMVLPAYRCRFITLSIISVPKGELKKGIKQLAAHFQKFVKRKFWKKFVYGYLRGLEITYNEKEQTWHPHYHLLCDSSWVAQAELSEEWGKLTDAPVVDIRLVGNGFQERENATIETLKYISKHWEIKDPEAMEELRTAMKSVRQFSASGTVREDIAARKTVIERQHPACPHCGRVHTSCTWGPGFRIHPDELKQLPGKRYGHFKTIECGAIRELKRLNPRARGEAPPPLGNTLLSKQLITARLNRSRPLNQLDDYRELRAILNAARKEKNAA